MGVETRFNSTDPARFTQPELLEKRFERLFTNQRDIQAWRSETDNQLTRLAGVLDARPNTTVGTGDRTITLSGTAGLRGKRTQTTPPGDTFTTWETWVAFPVAFPTAPVVTVTAETTEPGTTVTIRNVSTAGFFMAVNVATPVSTMTLHFQVWGDT